MLSLRSVSVALKPCCLMDLCLCQSGVKHGDAILMFNFGYLACKKIIEAYCVRAGAQVGS